jgi:uncharacterized SAM-binding protein YcdF (DUF218 family)
MLRRALETLTLPPASALLLVLLGSILRRRWRRSGRALQVAGIVWLWLAATPAFAGMLLGTLQTCPPLPTNGQLPAAQAIVVLSAEADVHAGEYGHPVIGPMTMQRLRYGIALHRRTNLPLLMSGGVPARGSPSLAALMADAAAAEFGVTVRWREEGSATTADNARMSALVLQAVGVRTVLLVSSAWHLPRAKAAFERAGLNVVPAPTAFRHPPADPLANWLPTWHAVRDTSLALHEWCGRAWYAVSDR